MSAISQPIIVSKQIAVNFISGTRGELDLATVEYGAIGMSIIGFGAMALLQALSRYGWRFVRAVLVVIAAN